MTDPGPTLDEFLTRLPFTPDPFQLEAMAAVEAGRNVVVTAPTGAGKTLVAEAAVHLAVHAGKRAFYTTPIKALSNQKFGDLRRAYGEDGVGLLTGDNVVNGEAPVVVMTTEVLRNMIYARSSALRRLGIVVLDEVHYLQDRYRGSVWEEVIIHLPPEVRLVSLSATIANPEEFTGWIRARRGATDLVVEEHRPVPLESLYAMVDRHHGHELVALPVLARDGDRPNPQVDRLLRKGRGRFRRFATPRRLEIVEYLLAEGLLPAIHFVFSRAGCDRSAQELAAARLPLVSVEESARIREIAARLTEHLHPTDLAVLGYDGWVDQLARGVAAHHAGMVPAFKETVEELFAAGLVKIVFATETLALGINMPARTVVLDSLSRFTGEAHELLQPGDYTQLTGRAGRRGIDERGTAVVLHSPHVPFDRVVDIAGAGAHPLTSSFQPTYNMAVNLVANYDRERAEELLRASFARYREELHREALVELVEEKEREAASLRKAAECERGDVWELLEADGEPAATDPWGALAPVRPGDVLEIPGGERVVVLLRSWGGRSPRLLVVGRRGEARRLRARTLPPGIRVAGSVDLPTPFRPSDPRYRTRVAKLLGRFTPSDVEPAADAAEEPHPVATCPDLHRHLKWARRARRAEREAARLRRRVARRHDGLVATFRGILSVLQRWGYVEGWRLTARGRRLRFVYNELDLLLTEAGVTGLLDELGPEELAATVSLFTFEARSSDRPGGWPTPEVAARGAAIDELWGRLVALEEAEGVPTSRRPDHGLAELVHGWAAGAELEDLFGEDEFAAGDFVRNCRQLLDLLRQLRDGFPGLAETASRAVAVVDRGVVAAGRV